MSQLGGTKAKLLIHPQDLLQGVNTTVEFEYEVEKITVRNLTLSRH